MLQTLEEIFKTDGVIVESGAAAEKSLAASRTSVAGFAGLLIAEVCFSSRASDIIIFDTVYERQPRVRRFR